MPYIFRLRKDYLLRAAMYSFNNRRTHLGPPSSSHASRCSCVSGRHATGAGLGGAGGLPAPSRLPPFMRVLHLRVDTHKRHDGSGHEAFLVGQ